MTHFARACLFATLCAALGATPAASPATDPGQLADQLVSLPTRAERTFATVTAQRELLLKEIAAAGDKGIAALIDRLLAIPDPEQGDYPRRGSVHLQVIRDIGTLGDAAIPPVQSARPRTTTPAQRMFLADVLSQIHTPAGTAALVALVNDHEDPVRMEAIQGLITCADKSADQGGGEKILPLLVKIAPDETMELSRTSICWAMRAALRPLPPAPSPDEKRIALAKELLHDRLKNDSAPGVRLAAACCLTEFGDNSGTDELKKAAIAMQANAGSRSIFGLENLVKAVERATGKKFGPIPMNPMLSSSSNAVPALEAQRSALLDKLVEWAKEDATTQPAAAPPGK